MDASQLGGYDFCLQMMLKEILRELSRIDKQRGVILQKKFLRGAFSLRNEVTSVSPGQKVLKQRLVDDVGVTVHVLHHARLTKGGIPAAKRQTRFGLAREERRKDGLVSEGIPTKIRKQIK